jgi:hypothetical protein
MIRGDDPQDRLMFVSDAEAIGYSMISTHGIENKYRNNSKHIICDINSNFVNFAEVTIDIRQTTSSVVACVTNLPELQGLRPLEKFYEKHKLHDIEIEAVEQKLEDLRPEINKVMYIKTT